MKQAVQLNKVLFLLHLCTQLCTVCFHENDIKNNTISATILHFSRSSNIVVLVLWSGDSSYFVVEIS